MVRASFRTAGQLVLGAALVALLGGQAKPAGTTLRVAMKAVDYEPKRVTARVGDTVEWTNEDVFAHTATVKGSFDVNVLPHRSGRAVMKTAGALAYICRYHPNMRGEIVVEP
jgi:plastocyanin